MLRLCHFSLCKTLSLGLMGELGRRDPWVKWGNHGEYLIIYTPQMGRHSDEEDTDGHVLCNDITWTLVIGA